MAQFSDGKDADALRTIGEVSEALSIKPHVLRYWEQQCSLLKPLKRSGGRRYYRPSDVALVERIDQLINDEGYTLKGAEAVLRAGDTGGSDTGSVAGQSAAKSNAADSAPVAKVGVGQGATLSASDTIAKLRGLRARLAKAIEA